jgi:hypothetical protein
VISFGVLELAREWSKVTTEVARRSPITASYLDRAVIAEVSSCGDHHLVTLVVNDRYAEERIRSKALPFLATIIEAASGYKVEVVTRFEEPPSLKEKLPFLAEVLETFGGKVIAVKEI